MMISENTEDFEEAGDRAAQKTRAKMLSVNIDKRCEDIVEQLQAQLGTSQSSAIGTSVISLIGALKNKKDFQLKYFQLPLREVMFTEVALEEGNARLLIDKVKSTITGTESLAAVCSSALKNTFSLKDLCSMKISDKEKKLCVQKHLPFIYLSMKCAINEYIVENGIEVPANMTLPKQFSKSLYTILKHLNHFEKVPGALLPSAGSDKAAKDELTDDSGEQSQAAFEKDLKHDEKASTTSSGRLSSLEATVADQHLEEQAKTQAKNEEEAMEPEKKRVKMSNYDE